MFSDFETTCFTEEYLFSPHDNIYLSSFLLLLLVQRASPCFQACAVRFKDSNAYQDSVPQNVITKTL